MRERERRTERRADAVAGRAAPVASPVPAAVRLAGNAAVARWAAAARTARVATGGASLEQSASKDREEGICGNFQRVRDFTPPDGKTGVIVQEVTRTFNVQKANGAALSGAAINAYCTDPNSAPHATDTHYWEAWDVGTAGQKHTDTWGLCSIIPKPSTLPVDKKGNIDYRGTTKGSFVMTGKAGFYEGTTATALGMRANAVACAGGLPSATADPQPGNQVGGSVDYRVDVVWDSTVKDRRTKPGIYSKVTES